MKPISNSFKTALNEFGREYKNIIGIYDYLILAAENDDLLITEDNNDIIAKISDVDIEKELTDEDIFSIKLVTKGNLLATGMRGLDFESPEDIEIGRVINYRLGLKLENQTYEFIDYGKFIVYKKEYDEVTENYSYTCYDLMLKTMRMIGSEFNFVENAVTANDLLLKTCDILSIDFNTATEDSNHKPTPYGILKNLNYDINIRLLLENKITYRDLLDLLCQYLGVSMAMDNNELKIKLLGNIEYDQEKQEWVINNNNPTIVDTLTAEYFKDKNIAFKTHYGEINTLEITGIDETKQDYIQDNDSIEANGQTVFSIKNNLLINDNGVWEESGHEIAKDIFDHIKDVGFELYDLDTNGILYLEWLDYFNVLIKGTNYKCLLLNSEITIKTGISEGIYTEIPEQNVSEYTTSNKDNDIISDTIRSRGPIYATTIDANQSINAKAVGKDLENAIKDIIEESGGGGGGGGVEIPIQDTPPQNPQINDLWIDTSDNDTLKYYDGNNWIGVSENVTGDTLPIGSMVPYGSTTPPTNWLVCDGSAVSRTTYAELFAVIGTSYGAGDGSTTFNIPNYKGKHPVGLDTSDADFNTIGKTGGSKTHKHLTAMGFNNNYLYGYAGSDTNPAYGSEVVYNIKRNSLQGFSQSDNQPVRLAYTNNASTVQPYITTNYIIKAFQSSGTVANVANDYSTSQTDTYSCDYINKKTKKKFIKVRANQNQQLTTAGTVNMKFQVVDINEGNAFQLVNNIVKVIDPSITMVKVTLTAWIELGNNSYAWCHIGTQNVSLNNWKEYSTYMQPSTTQAWHTTTQVALCPIDTTNNFILPTVYFNNASNDNQIRGGTYSNSVYMIVEAMD